VPAMGLFGRKRQREAVSLSPLLVEGKRARLAVGSEYNPGAYRGRREGEAIVVELVAETKNPHDRNAVALVFGGQLAGYLGRGPAAEYQPSVRRANSLGWSVQVHGEIERVTGELAVRVRVPHVADLDAAVDAASLT